MAPDSRLGNHSASLHGSEIIVLIHLLDERDYLFEGRRFAEEEVLLRIGHQLSRILVIETGDENEGHITGVGKFPDVTVKPGSVECRHEHIGDDQVHNLRFEQFPRLLAIICKADLMAVILKHPSNDIQERPVVVYNQNLHGSPKLYETSENRGGQDKGYARKELGENNEN